MKVDFKHLMPAMAAAIMAFAVVPAEAVVVGNHDSGNCYPFSCFASDGGSLYQQVYSADAFSEPTAINTISFFKNDPGQMDSATYDISFYTTANPVSSLSSVAADNLGTLLSVFGTYTIGGTMPDTLTFVGNAFTYDPGAGNLLMQVVARDLTVSAIYDSFFQADYYYTGVSTSRYWSYGGSPSGLTGAGALVTEFSSSGAVPEPATWALMIFGFGAVGTAMRKAKRNQVAKLAAA